jgi:uncharacterized protein (DUF697 family)
MAALGARVGAVARSCSRGIASSVVTVAGGGSAIGAVLASVVAVHVVASGDVNANGCCSRYTTNPAPDPPARKLTIVKTCLNIPTPPDLLAIQLA